MLEQIPETIGLALVLVGAATVALLARARAGKLITAAGGLHFNMLLFFGLGILAYGVSPISEERDYRILDSAIRAAWPLALAYSAVVLWEVRTLRKGSSRGRARHQLARPSDVDWGITVGSLALALVGYAGSQFDLASSGIGTIFPVLKLLWYPVIASVVANTRTLSPGRILLLAVTLGASATLALLSFWRSEMLLVGGAVTLGLALRGRKWLFLAPLLLVALVGIALPFADLKKTNYEYVMRDPYAAFDESLAMPMEGRTDFVTRLWAVRVNGMRELGFVVDGLESGRTQLAEGRSYGDALLQLVPRILWPGKPSFNTRLNYELARDIGLVGPTDFDTSWGVNLYAEAVWNFGTGSLWWFVPLAFVAATALDSSVQSRIRKPGIQWYAYAALFFFFMQAVGLVSAATYVLWIVLLGITADRLIRRRVGSVEGHAEPRPFALRSLRPGAQGRLPVGQRRY